MSSEKTSMDNETINAIFLVVIFTLFSIFAVTCILINYFFDVHAVLSVSSCGNVFTLRDSLIMIGSAVLGGSPFIGIIVTSYFVDKYENK